MIKKILQIAICSLLVIGLTSCTANNSTSTPSSIGFVPENAQTDNKNNSGDLFMKTDVFGGIYNVACQTKDGYYDLFSISGASSSILYTDKNTTQRIFLCNRPECTHNNDACSSWFNTYGGSILFTDTQESSLFLLSYGMIDQEQPSKDKIGKIVKIDLNGQNRKEIFTLSSNENFIDGIIMDNENIYASIMAIDVASAIKTKKLIRIDKNTGERKDVFNFNADMLSSRVYGAFQNYIVIENVSDSECHFDLYDITTQATTKIYSFDYLQNNQKQMTFGDKLYSIRMTNEKDASIYEIDLKTGVEKMIVSSYETFDLDATFVLGFYDNKMQISVTNNQDINKIKFTTYNLDLDTYELSSNSLKYKRLQDELDVAIRAEFDDSFLVDMGVEESKIIMFGNDGTPYETQAISPIYSLITKNDFWNGNPNYILIKDNVISFLKA